MEWFWGAALAPLLLCGLMCGIPMLFVAVGWRRGNQQAGSSSHGGRTQDAPPEPVRETSTQP